MSKQEFTPVQGQKDPAAPWPVVSEKGSSKVHGDKLHEAIPRGENIKGLPKMTSTLPEYHQGESMVITGTAELLRKSKEATEGTLKGIHDHVDRMNLNEGAESK